MAGSHWKSWKPKVAKTKINNNLTKIYSGSDWSLDLNDIIWIENNQHSVTCKIYQSCKYYPKKSSMAINKF